MAIQVPMLSRSMQRSLVQAARSRWLLVLLALCWLAPVFAADAPTETLSGPALVSALREGGLMLDFRHTSTDFGQNDDQMTGYEDCAKQRNLTEQGREEARQIGAAIQRLQLPI